ncbi:hypothetical protein PLESTB_000907100 [Pleodorina starrii]|uniref:ADP-ribosylation factor-like protein 6 n=1 Tax=Pleodorina starrii TaxID=330485 RepID=A0A9W6BML5_9CHLO|nr:hypothetical protein PLESTM_001518700 [Pleodorina starrii]GLC54798.1 hypothetical protein PLESTB_000907100 [Pleodorina starrii]GLC73761.1 hypothetical protein PLESTF_001416200 [Pleodorina starrii]
MGFLRSLLIRLGLVKTKVGLLIVGLTNSGKSTVVARLTKEPVADVAPTVGFAVESVKVDGLSVTIFDMSGNSRYHELWKLYYKETTAVMFVLDAADQARFPEADAVLQELLKADQLKKVPLLFLCNKMDLDTAAKPAEVAAALHLPTATSRGFQLQSCSALRDEGIKEGMQWLLDQV